MTSTDNNRPRGMIVLKGKDIFRADFTVQYYVDADAVLTTPLALFLEDFVRKAGLSDDHLADWGTWSFEVEHATPELRPQGMTGAHLLSAIGTAPAVVSVLRMQVVWNGDADPAFADSPEERDLLRYAQMRVSMDRRPFDNQAYLERRRDEIEWDCAYDDITFPEDKDDAGGPGWGWCDDCESQYRYRDGCCTIAPESPDSDPPTPFRQRIQDASWFDEEVWRCCG